MTTVKSWKDTLKDSMPTEWAKEIDIFETQLELKKKGKIDDKLFAETRLRRGAYGQRYDNGQRHDGEKTQTLVYPNGDLAKGPSTLWDAPGMQRIKIPFGKLNADQLETLCDLAEEYSDQILHVTTRQDIQLHFVHIEDAPDLMRRLAAVGITTREACGNSVRNVTACPYSGVCQDESFDVTPYANALTFFLLGHGDTQDMGRKFKVAFSGCKQHACGLTNFHDIGLIARTKQVGTTRKRGFEFYVGGGLGAVPQAAWLFDDFVAEEEVLPLSQAITRVFARLGEKENRQRARMKFLVKKLGLDEFRRLVLEEREQLRRDPRWSDFLSDLEKLDEKPLKGPSELGAEAKPEGFEAWYRTNVRPQRQSGYSMAIVNLPLGDFTPAQGRALVDIVRRYTGVTLRTTADQNLLFRWVSNQDLPKIYEEFRAIGLGLPIADTISDVVSCPGTDTCKLGISSSRGLSGELRKQLLVIQDQLDPAAQALHIKCSGCFNSCGQHHVADIGFLGVSRNVNGRRVPHFQLVVGGQWENNAGSYGLAIGAIPSKRVPEAVKRLTQHYVDNKEEGETYYQFIKRIGKKVIRGIVDEFSQLPPYDQDPSYYSDWGDPREYTTGDMGVGECAGEVISFVDMALAASERQIFEAQLLLDDGDSKGAAQRAYAAMLQAARSLARERNINIGEDPDEIVREFRTHFYDTKLFFDPFAGGKFAHYLFRAHGEGADGASKEGAHQLIEEAQLFVEAAHQCYSRLGSATT